jgi:hypothetical protein
MLTPVDLRRFRYLLVFSDEAELARGMRAILEPWTKLVAGSGRWSLYESKVWDTPIDAPDAPIPRGTPNFRDMLGRVLLEKARPPPPPR